MVTVDRELTKQEYAKLIGQACYEKEQYGEVKAKCPICNSIIEVELLGNSARTKCSCGYMTDLLRGI